MKRNYSAFIFRVTCAICILNVVRYYAVKGIEKHGNLIKAFNALLPWDNPLNSTLQIIIVVSSIALCVVGIKYCIDGLKAPKLNWKEGLNRLATAVAALIGIVCILLLFVTTWTETKSYITAFVVTITVFIVGSILVLIGDTVINRIWSGFRHQDNDEYYEDDEYDGEL